LATSKRIKHKIMDTKKIVIVFVLFLVMQNINSQILIVPTRPLENRLDYPQNAPGYYKDVNGHFDKFIGTWEYNGSDKYLRIEFYKVEKVSISGYFSIDDDGGDIFYDMLFSFIEYKEKQNGQWITIYNTFGKEPVTDFTYYGHNSAIEGGRIIDSNFIFLSYSEPLLEECKKGRGTLDLKYQLGSNPPQLLWERDPVVYVTDRERKCYGIEREPFKIPANLVLTKINP